MIKIQFRRDSAANWTSVDPVLLEGELGYETDTVKFKIGDGTNKWSVLDYQLNNITTETFTGSDCSGVDGAKNRTLTVTGTPFIISVEGSIITNIVDYTIAVSVVTFLNDIWDEQRITCWRLG